MSDLEFNDCSPSSTGMPQLNLREVFAAAQDETIPSATEFTVLPAPVLTDKLQSRPRFGHSEWTNIGFVTIALTGGLFSAFYFFNGAEVLRAAGRWSREFLYPQPQSAPANNTAPAIEDAAAARAAASSTPQTQDNSSSGPFGRNYWSGDVATPAPFASANAIGANGSAANAGGFFVGSALDQLSTLGRGGDSLFQALYQTVPAGSQVNTGTGAVRKTVASSRKTIAGAGTLVLQRTPVTVRSISNSNNASTSQGVQQTTTAVQSGKSSLGFNPGLGTQGLSGQLGLGGGRGAAGGGGLSGGIGGALGGLGAGRGGR